MTYFDKKGLRRGETYTVVPGSYSPTKNDSAWILEEYDPAGDDYNGVRIQAWNTVYEDYEDANEEANRLNAVIIEHEERMFQSQVQMAEHRWKEHEVLVKAGLRGQSLGEFRPPTREQGRFYTVREVTFISKKVTIERAMTDLTAIAEEE